MIQRFYLPKLREQARKRNITETKCQHNCFGRMGASPHRARETRYFHKQKFDNRLTSLYEDFE